MNDLRIRRYDSRNLVIETSKQTERGPKWVITGYYGSAWAMASKLVDMLADVPNAADLVVQVDALMALIDHRTEAITRQLEAILQADESRVIELEK